VSRVLGRVAATALTFFLAYMGNLSTISDPGGHVRLASPLPAAPKAEALPASGAEHARAHTLPQVGQASWYGPGLRKRLTANGEHFNQKRLTAAHRTLPFNTMLRVTNLQNGLSVVVRVNDRGPFVDGRDIDLTARAASVLHMKRDGVVPVLIEPVHKDAPQQNQIVAELP